MNDTRRRTRADGGYSLIELMLVLGIAAVLSSMAVITIGASKDTFKADSAMRVVLSQMNQAREMAITQRRYMQVTFDLTTSRISVVREDTATMTTILSTVPFEGGVKLLLISGVPDTPDQFGMTAASAFTSSGSTFASATGTLTVAKFTPDGTLVDANGRTANGSVFLGVPSVVRSARAVTVLGSTGRVRGYTYNGTVWKPV